MNVSKELEEMLVERSRMIGWITLALVTVLTGIFAALKLTDRLDWSWTWVTAPLWVYGAVALSIVLLMFTFVSVLAFGRTAVSALTILTTFAFVCLKILDVIAWSWVWVLAPVWVPAALGISLVVIVATVVFVWNVGVRVKKKRDRGSVA